VVIHKCECDTHVSMVNSLVVVIVLDISTLSLQRGIVIN